MMTYKMTEELARVLTEDLLDECWHETIVSDFASMKVECKHCHISIYSTKWRHKKFTTPSDQKAVMRKLVDKGLWDEFERWCFAVWLKDTESGLLSEYFSWLFLEEERFCVLAAQFMEERRKESELSFSI